MDIGLGKLIKDTIYCDVIFEETILFHNTMLDSKLVIPDLKIH